MNAHLSHASTAAIVTSLELPKVLAQTSIRVSAAEALGSEETIVKTSWTSVLQAHANIATLVSTGWHHMIASALRAGVVRTAAML